jgi:hypothetical protein
LPIYIINGQPTAIVFDRACRNVPEFCEILHGHNELLAAIPKYIDRPKDFVVAIPRWIERSQEDARVKEIGH